MSNQSFIVKCFVGDKDNKSPQSDYEARYKGIGDTYWSSWCSIGFDGVFIFIYVPSKSHIVQFRDKASKRIIINLSTAEPVLDTTHNPLKSFKNTQFKDTQFN